MEGWIKIHRQIQKHWIWDNPEYLKAWLAILLSVNHEPKKVLIHGELFECDRGQSLMSLQNWVKIFGKNWTIQKVRTFFTLLENDAMICTKGMRKTTCLTVCNYDSYQDLQQTNNKQTTDKQQANNKQITTNKNDKNDKNDKNEKKEIKETISKDIVQKKVDAKASTLTRRDEFYKSLIPFLSTYGKDMIRDFFDYWSEQNKSGTQMRFEKQPTWEVAKRLATWNKRDTFKNQNNGNTKIQSTSSREAKEQSRRNLVKLADQILGIDESEDNGRSFR